MHLVAISPGEIKRVVLLEVLAGKNGVNGILDVWIKYKDRRFIWSWQIEMSIFYEVGKTNNFEMRLALKRQSYFKVCSDHSL